MTGYCAAASINSIVPVYANTICKSGTNQSQITHYPIVPVHFSCELRTEKEQIRNLSLTAHTHMERKQIE